MKSLTRTQLLMKWLNYQKRYIVLFFLFFGITLFTTMQYQLYWRPIFYSMIMCGFLSGCFLLIGFIKYYRRYHAIYETYLNREHSLQTLPFPADYMEENYQLLLEAIFHSRYDVIESMKKKDTDDRDYYTRWIHQIKTPIAAMNLLLQAKDYENNKMTMRQELYKIEQAFRISKNDLQTRPIFHFKEQPIKLHILICFMALVVSKHIELKTGVSIRKFIDESKKIVDGEILNQITQKMVTIKAQPTQKMKELIAKLEIPH